MAIYTRVEFAAECGLTQGNLSNYIKRSKVVVSEKGEVDTDNLVNKMFLERCRNRKPKEKVEKKITQNGKKKASGKRRTVDEYTQGLQDKIQFDNRKRLVEIELKEHELQKKRGELIPTESVRQVFDLHSESIKSAYIEASDNVIVVMGQRKGFTPEDIAHVRKQFVGIVNRAVDGAIKGTRSALDALVEEFSVKRGVGQHD